MAALSFVLSFYLRVGNGIFDYKPSLIWSYDIAFAAIAGIVFLSTGLYRGIWRYASLPDLLALVQRGDARHPRLLPADVPGDAARRTCRARSSSSTGSCSWRCWAARASPIASSRTATSTTCSSARATLPIPVLVIGAREDADLFIRATAARPGAHLSRRRPHRRQRDARRARHRRRAGAGHARRDPRGGGAARAPRRPAAAPRHQHAAASTAPRCGASSTSPMRSASRWRACRASPISRRRARTRPRRIEPVAIEDLLGRPQTVLDRAGMKRAGRRPARARHRRRRHHRRRAGAPDRRVRVRRGWRFSTTASSRSTASIARSRETLSRDCRARRSSATCATAAGSRR